MLKFDEQKQLDSVNGALALRGRIEEIVDAICAEGYKNICWLGHWRYMGFCAAG